MFKQLGILALSILAAVGASAAQPRAEDFVKLKDDVARLNAQQQQILDSLDELKRMIKGPGGGTKVSQLRERRKAEGFMTNVLNSV